MQTINVLRDDFGSRAALHNVRQRVVPSISLLAEFPVAVVEKVAEERGTVDVSKAYLEFLYSKEGQEIVASFNNRVHNPEVKAEYADKFPEVKLVTVEEIFGGWGEANETHFSDGGVLDQIQAGR